MTALQLLFHFFGGVLSGYVGAKRNYYLGWGVFFAVLLIGGVIPWK